LQRGTIDRSLFASNANAYFSDQALNDFASSVGPLGALSGFVQTRKPSGAEWSTNPCRASFPGRTLGVWTDETADGKLEQLQVAPQG
jgi:D-alanyl-D-alanine carboxypeptidase